MTVRSKDRKKATPLMDQYNGIKAEHPEALVLFRVGDFYETFGEDAIKTSQILGIVLTKRHNGAASEIELAGFPHHAIDTYLPKLVRAGERVAICDQLENPKETKTIVKRGVVEIVTPGVSLNDEVLDQRANNFLCALTRENDRFGFACVDVSTGEFSTTEGSKSEIDKLLHAYAPKEFLYQRGSKDELVSEWRDKVSSYAMDDWAFSQEQGKKAVQDHFGTSTLKGLALDDMPLAVVAAGVVIKYLEKTMHSGLGHILSISRIKQGSQLWLDRATVRNLELIHPQHAGGKALVDILDHTVTPMGGRALKRDLLFPSMNIKTLNARLDAVEQLTGNVELLEDLMRELRNVGDLERAMSKIAARKIDPRGLIRTAHAFAVIDPFIKRCKAMKGALAKTARDMPSVQDIAELISGKINENAPVLLNKGNVICSGVDEELDALRELETGGKNEMEQIRIREMERSGIASLKIGHNNVFGYYLEVRNSHKDKVPEEWDRKQTLVNAERYVCGELKELEVRILSAEEKIQVIEQRLYNDLIDELCQHFERMTKTCAVVSELDRIMCFAKLAVKNKYVRPELNDGKSLKIVDGRHPVIEDQLPVDQQYVPNDISLDMEGQQLIMITGPNMSGKSAVLRQTALIVIMAQIGCFVPASSAHIGIFDRVFTRVGASDNISAGESTFMVEMNETASILNNLSDRSLVLLDEIGRGTSTYDGISIAWAIAEFIHEHPKARAKTLFATHYHELNEMADLFPRINNYNVSIKEVGKKVLFLRKLQPGGSAHSFGIHVAKMAGMPQLVVDRANKLLLRLEEKHGEAATKGRAEKLAENGMQLSFVQLDDPVLQRIREELETLDINTLTPIEALMKLNEIKRIGGGG